MISRQINRFFHSTGLLWNVNKSDLAKLRKKTGYTFANCKKALEINNNVDEAEKWLKQQAQSLGWSKASKLEGRKTSQGLVGLLVRENRAVMLEINCETDFVARNKKFKSFVELSVNSCFHEVSKINTGSELMKVTVGSDELKTLPGPDGKSLSDLSALTISELGENLNLKRAIYVTCPEGMQLASYAHPNSQNNSNVLTGKYGAIVAYVADSYDTQRQEWAMQLCQHVVGMNPKQVGVVGEDEPAMNKDDELTMIHQEFLLDPELTVAQFISNAGIKIVDFVRIECGEPLEAIEDSVPVKAVG
ncbi:elongation factor Ts, mitochondrial [Halyomorpha halys]|uniref:elongation factor Ts, mitochondrial n=1 Tax=Halyomorpha halys TaxID=286706 RepID=UPI0006D525B7|nr:elongation factor Ts, mitochondrial [Halyomorpha halys]